MNFFKRLFELLFKKKQPEETKNDLPISTAFGDPIFVPAEPLDFSEKCEEVERLRGEIAWLQLGTGKNLATGTQIMDMQKMRERAERAEAERDALRQLVVEVLDDLAEAKWSMGTDWVSRAQAASGSSHN